MTEGVKKSPRKAGAKGAKQADPFVGRVFNERFKVIELIARGGLGAVYKSEQAPLGRICALKILRPRYEETTPDEFNKRFFLEASIASKLTHPNNVTIYDYGHTEDDIYFMAMEYLEGRTLAKTIRVDGPLGEERTSHMARQMCRALREAHSLGVIHRDIKPGNIFISQEHDETDFVKVLDFGLVKEVNVKDEDLTQAGIFMGSPKYMAPEQIQGLDVDVRTDIYALGVVLFEMVTGKPPFDRRSSVQTLIAHLNETPPSLREIFPDCEVSPNFESLIHRCMAKDPNQRPNSVDDLLNALKFSPNALRTATISGVSGEYALMSSSGSSMLSSPAPSGPHVFMAGQTVSDGVVAQAQDAGSLRSPKTPKIVWGALAALGIAAGLGAAFMYVNRDDPQQDAMAAVAPPVTPSAEPAASPSVAKVEPPPPASTTAAPEPAPPLRIETKPSGASVRLDDTDGKQLCEATPCDINRAELPDAAAATLLIAKAGFVQVRKDVDGKQDKLTVDLIPLSSGAPKPKGGDDKPAAPQPTTYKIDPYG